MGTKSGFQVQGSGAEIYERCWVPSLMGACADDLVAAAEVIPGDRVLDVACGSGVVARRAFQQSLPDGKVVGSDINEAMLATAGRIAFNQGMAGIDWQIGDASKLAFENSSFDVVLCQQGLQFMPDRAAAMSEMARVLRPGGRIAVSVWKNVSQFGAVMSEVLDKHFGAGVTAPWAVAYSFGDRGELRELATNNGFENAFVRFDVKIARHPDPHKFVAGAIAGSPLAGAFENANDETQKTILQEIVRGLDKCMDDGGLAYPAECHTLTARVP